MRPRVLYFAIFVFYSLSGGRFTATFLEHQLLFSENWMISAAVASQLLTSSLCKPWLGGLADSWEAANGVDNSGRLRVVSLGLMISTVATLLHGLGSSLTHWITNSSNTADSFEMGNTTMNEPQSKIPLPLLMYHLLLRTVFAVGTAACSPALDGLTLAQLERDCTDRQNYGKERMYGALSWGISHVILGKVIDLFGYSALYGTIVLAFVGCVIIFHVYSQSTAALRYAIVNKEPGIDNEGNPCEQRTKETPKRNNNENRYDNTNTHGVQTDNVDGRLSTLDLVRILSQNVSTSDVLFIMSLFALFIGMSVVESMIFLYFEFLGGSTIMCGLTVCVTVLFELPLFHYAPNVLKLLGSTTMLQLACLAYVVRVIGYSFVPLSHSYLVLLFEPLHGVTIAFAMTSSVAFADGLVPKGYESSGQGFMSMVCGLGQFVGLCIGGVLGGRNLYRVLALIVTLGCLPLSIRKCCTSVSSYRRRKIREADGQQSPHEAQQQESIELYDFQL